MSGLEDLLREGAKNALLVEVMEKFVAAYDAWAATPHRTDERYNEMVTARAALELMAPIIRASAKL